MFGLKKKKNDGIDEIYKNIDGVQYADPATRSIIGDFNNAQKDVLIQALDAQYPAGAVAYPDIPYLYMERALLAWGDLYYAQKTKRYLPVSITRSDIYEVAEAFTKADEKHAMLMMNHEDTSLSNLWDKHSYEEDIENTMMHLFILDGYGRNLLELSDDPLNIKKFDIIYLAAGIQCGFDDTKEYLKKGTINKKKILKLCKKNLVRLPHLRDGWAEDIDNSIAAERELRGMFGM